MRLTENFNLNEFDSKDGAEMPDEIIIKVKRLAGYLQIIRDYLGVPISINSGYRSKNHNEAVGGKDNGFHPKGMAADMVAHGKNPKEVYDAIEFLTDCGKLPQGGMKAYSTFTHWDYRGYRARW